DYYCQSADNLAYHWVF
nr:immunoglobulin light chain junction region [Macaca mulatta]MOX12001.1 immunoglobulin light chain junction region [Macaca mulatta]MOX12373.1 immunoglobulin light chain junction region [Macaca mulatta]MOX12396.1 immunoglobulin light chain junction region [Macaca mulatta]MOX12789.1 immunoglobulin light chain junction region [Macaca mulatta]